jgi:ATP-dependent Lon protease
LSTKEKYEQTKLPMVPIRDVVIFPFMMVPFVIGRESSVSALEAALKSDKRIFLATQHDAAVDNPKPGEIYQVGTIANIVQSLKLPDGNTKVLVEGIERARILQLYEEDGFWKASLRLSTFRNQEFTGYDTLSSRLTQQFEQYLKLSQNAGADQAMVEARVDDLGRMADIICKHLAVSIEEKQELIELFSPVERGKRLVELLDVELEKLQVDRSVQNRVKRQMERAQKEYYLNEKIKAIHKELGRKDEKSEFDELRRKVESAGMPKDAHGKAIQELRRLEMMPPMSAESTVSRNYLDWLIAIPWKKKSREIRDIELAEKILNEDHYGLDKVKERILEFLAVRQMVKKPKGSILCFVGPPGVGKTSLGMSIARATGRKFVRLALGGVRDEAEIRGHRRTYIGALPGQIIQMIKKAGTVNPVFLLDEVDKMSADFRGDPSAALLEVLDSEQNTTFQDHYLDVEYDLSQVMFIATANVLHTIPGPLQDRMEVLRLPGYTEYEKVEIARRFLVPKQMEATGLKPTNLIFENEGIQALIRHYTREAGVRNLERELSSVCRKITRSVIKDTGANTVTSTVTIGAENVSEYSGIAKYRSSKHEEQNEIGFVTGLAWTEVGGEILSTEATLMSGTGKLTLTGKLGDVMQESAQAAMSYVRSRAHQYGIPKDFYRRLDLHIHVPEGAIPKDGPSAGITMATSLISALTRIPVRADVAMTGEITLRGKVLPIGGVKEKLLAAHRAGIRTIILPKDNQKDLADIPADILSDFTVHLAEYMDDVLKIALTRAPISMEEAVQADQAEHAGRGPGFPARIGNDPDPQESVMH